MLERIMVIDDQPADQLLAKYAIQEYNPQAVIYEAFDGIEALAILKSIDVPPDVIFLDINMPRMNGFEFLEAYQANTSQATVIVMLTSSDQAGDREKCGTFSTVAGYETKPVTAEILAELERRLHKGA